MIRGSGQRLGEWRRQVVEYGETIRENHGCLVSGSKTVLEKGGQGSCPPKVQGILGLAIASSARHRDDQVETLRVAWQDQVKHSDYQVHTACRDPSMVSVVGDRGLKSHPPFSAIFGIDLSTALASVYRQYSSKRPVREFPINYVQGTLPRLDRCGTRTHNL